MKSYLRSTMSEDRLNFLAIQDILSAVAKSISLEAVIHKFRDEYIRQKIK